MGYFALPIGQRAGNANNGYQAKPRDRRQLSRDSPWFIRHEFHVSLSDQLTLRSQRMVPIEVPSLSLVASMATTSTATPATITFVFGIMA